MRTRILCVLLVFFSLFVETITAQQEQPSSKETIEQLEAKKEKVVEEEKSALKRKVQKIQERQDKGEISKDEAQKLKREAAKIHAANIENRINIIENKIALVFRGEKDEQEDPWADSETSAWEFIKPKDFTEKEKRRKEKRTRSDLVVAFGLNNALQSGQSVNDLDFKIAGSRFFELGYAWNTRVFDDSNWLRFKYGFSFQFNGLKPTDNRYFVQQGDRTALEEFELDLDKSKFRLDNLVFPLHFEFGPSNRRQYQDGTYFSTHKKFRVGLGGYAGFNLGKIQKLKYKENGDRVKQKIKHDFNTNEFIYGLSAYVGWGDMALYAKYDLNPIFETPNAELRNISIGLRFDID